MSVRRRLATVAGRRVGEISIDTYGTQLLALLFSFRYLATDEPSFTPHHYNSTEYGAVVFARSNVGIPALLADGKSKVLRATTNELVDTKTS